MLDTLPRREPHRGIGAELGRKSLHDCRLADPRLAREEEEPCRRGHDSGSGDSCNRAPAHPTGTVRPPGQHLAFPGLAAPISHRVLLDPLPRSLPGEEPRGHPSDTRP